MSDDGKRVPEIADYGDIGEDFVDELARIDEDGVVSHLIFTRRIRLALGGGTHTERRVVARLIVPTHMVKRIGHLMVAGTCGQEVSVSVPEDARFH